MNMFPWLVILKPERRTPSVLKRGAEVIPRKHCIYSSPWFRHRGTHRTSKKGHQRRAERSRYQSGTRIRKMLSISTRYYHLIIARRRMAKDELWKTRLWIRLMKERTLWRMQNCVLSFFRRWRRKRYRPEKRLGSVWTAALKSIHEADFIDFSKKLEGALTFSNPRKDDVAQPLLQSSFVMITDKAGKLHAMRKRTLVWILDNDIYKLSYHRSFSARLAKS